MKIICQPRTAGDERGNEDERWGGGEKRQPRTAGVTDGNVGDYINMWVLMGINKY